MNPPLKPGDRVRVYGGTHSPITATVTEIEDTPCGGMLRIDPDDDFFHDFILKTDLFHPKQCRRLKKKERRRIWAKPSPCQRSHPHAEECSKHFDDFTSEEVAPGPEWVRFIEVKRRKE